MISKEGRILGSSLPYLKIMIAVSDKARDYLLKKRGDLYLFNARPISLC
jgi:hypothetical protein